MPRPLELAIALCVVGLAASCARIEQAEQAGRQEAQHQELERVHQELLEQEQVLQDLREQLREQEQTWQVLEARRETRNPPIVVELSAALEQVEELQSRLQQEEARHAEIRAEAQRLIGAPLPSQ